MSTETIKVKFKVHYPTPEELVEDSDAVSLIKYILNCYMDNTLLEGNRLHGMMDRAYLYNWSIAGALMYRRIETVAHVELENLRDKRAEVKAIITDDEYNYEKILRGLDLEIMLLEGVWGSNDIPDHCKYEFFLSDYGFELFTNVIQLEARKTRRFMTTEELQAFQDNGQLETWLNAPKHDVIEYRKSKGHLDADFFILMNTNASMRAKVRNKEEKGVVGWLSPEGELIVCRWSAHSATAYEILEEKGYEYHGDGAYAFDDAEQEFEKQGYIKFWVMMDDWGVGSGCKPNKAQIRWFEKHIGILAPSQIRMFERMAER